MTVADITPYLIELERSGFTGKVILNFHKGSVAKEPEGYDKTYRAFSDIPPMNKYEARFEKRLFDVAFKLT